jgi:hypothetical protein
MRKMTLPRSAACAALVASGCMAAGAPAAFALNPQPLPPRHSLLAPALNPQPLPPGLVGGSTFLNPQPLPPRR